MVLVRIFDPSGKESKRSVPSDSAGERGARARRHREERKKSKHDEEDESKKRSESKYAVSRVADAPIAGGQIEAKNPGKQSKATAVSSPTELCSIEQFSKAATGSSASIGPTEMGSVAQRQSSATQKRRVREQSENATVGAAACSRGTDTKRRLSNGEFAAAEETSWHSNSDFDQKNQTCATNTKNTAIRTPLSWSPNVDENGVEKFHLDEGDFDDVCFKTTREGTPSTILGESDSFSEKDFSESRNGRGNDDNNSTTHHTIINDIENTMTEIYELDKKRREQSLLKRQRCITLSCVVLVIAAVVAISFAVVISNSKEDFVNDVLPNHTRVSLQNASSPQFMALDWLQSDPSYNSVTTSEKLNRFALATLYYATNGQQWSQNTNWLSNEVHECEWFTSMPTSSTTGTRNPCQHLALSNNALNGTLPQEVGLLTFLRTLDISENPYLKGTIPSHLGLLSTIEVVDLQGNSLTGTLPTSLFTGLLHLKELHLQKNGFQGTIPTVIGQHLQNLAVLNVFDNFITGTLGTEMGQLQSLEHIDMSSNKITASIPMDTWCNLTQLNFLSLGKNKLSGSLQEELGLFTGLNFLSLADSNINATIPTQIGMLKSLQRLDLSFNALTGALPSEVGFLHRMENFRMSNNELNGTIPSMFRAFTHLNWRDLSSNHFTSTIPSEIGLLTNLQTLALHNNYLTGNIPSHVGLLGGANVRRFDVSNNSLTGNIPSELGLLSRLEYLHLHNNLLTGSLSANLWQLRYARSFSLHHNALTGTLMTEVGLMQNLDYFLVNDNSLIGALPSELGFLRRMRVVELQNNKFTGTIPTLVGNVSGLERMLLNNNNAVSGTIPNILGRLTNLRSFYVFETSIGGAIPPGVCSLFELGQLLELVVDCEDDASIKCDCNCTCK